MAVAKDIKINEIHQGPGDLWKITTAPVDATPRLTLGAEGTPLLATHGACAHLGALASATVSVKPTIGEIDLDTLDAPIDGYVTGLEARIEAELYQTEMQKLAIALGVGSYLVDPVDTLWKQVTFGGNLVVPEFCLAAISPLRTNAQRHLVAVLFNAAATGGFSLSFGRAAASRFKVSFVGLADLGRTAGKQVGNIYQTTTDCAGEGGALKLFATDEVAQGPGDLWIIAPAPDDDDVRVTLDAKLLPDGTAHADSIHLGATEGPITLTVEPRIEMIRIDQCDAPVGVYIAQIAARLEAELSQAAAAKLAHALGVGTPGTGQGYTEATFGGVNQPPTICVAAIAPKRTAPAQALAACLYKVNAVDGVQFQLSRRKASTYKVIFHGRLDLDRTPGQQIGVVWETLPVE